MDSIEGFKTFIPKLADYAIANKIQDEPVFAWWVPYVIKKRKTIIQKIKSKYWQRTHKYEIRIPKTVKEANDCDKENSNTMWSDTIKKEMPKIVAAMEEHEGDVQQLVGYHQISGHLIFDIKLGENFQRKARYFADGHKTITPPSVTYSTVVSHNSVQICLIIAAMNNLEFLSGGIENACLLAPCREKVWLRAGPKFGHLEGKVMIVKKALYGLKSSGAAFRSHLTDTLDSIGFKGSLANPDVWMRPATRPTGETYYEYILCYVDVILCISHDARRPMDEIKKTLKFKNDKVEEPDFYLGASLKKKEPNGKKVWTMTPYEYLRNAIATVESQLAKRGKKLPARATTPMVSGYYPKLDSSPDLDQDNIMLFQ